MKKRGSLWISSAEEAVGEHGNKNSLEKQTSHRILELFEACFAILGLPISLLLPRYVLIA